MYEPIEIRQSELNTLVIQSVRYCLGRMTYAVSECAEIVRKYWHCLGKGSQTVIRRDIAEEIEKHNGMLNEERYRSQLENGYSHFLGHECDAFTWIELLNWIDKQEKENEQRK